MSQIPTVKIKGGKGEPDFLIINAEDFDEKVHTPYVESKKSTLAEAAGDKGLSRPLSKKMPKDALKDEAKRLGVEVAEDATNQAIVDVIEAHEAADGAESENGKSEDE